MILTQSPTVPTWLLAVLIGITLLPANAANPDKGSPPNDSRILPNDSAEPYRQDFSLQAALEFSQKAASQWSQQRQCVTCHTNGLQLITAARLSPLSQLHKENRAFATKYLQKYIENQEEPVGQKGSVEGIVSTTCFLAISDMVTKGSLDPTTLSALDHIWTLQDSTGAWSDWLKCGWPPYESDDHFGVSLVALACSFLPTEAQQSPQAKNGIRRLKSWLQRHPPQNLHHQGMLIWASTRWSDLITDEQKIHWRKQLLQNQQKDGGWRLVDLGASQWKRPKDTLESLPSDAYATAFSIFFLKNTALPSSHSAIQKGLTWLRQRQRQSGRWFTRSPRKDGHHYISHAATHFALLAFASCKDTEDPSKDTTSDPAKESH